MITLDLYINGVTSTYQAPVATYNEAEAIVKRIYGDDVIITNWSNSNTRSNNQSKGFWGLF